MTEEPRALALPEDEDEDPNLSVIERPDDSGVGWYRCVDAADTSLALGAVVWVEKREPSRPATPDGVPPIKVHYRHGENGWYADEAWFEAHFEPDPDGELHRQQEIAALMAQMEEYGRA